MVLSKIKAFAEAYLGRERAEDTVITVVTYSHDLKMHAPSLIFVSWKSLMSLLQQPKFMAPI